MRRSANLTASMSSASSALGCGFFNRRVLIALMPSIHGVLGGARTDSSASLGARTADQRSVRGPGTVAAVPVVAAAVCPHPPLLVPEIAAGAAPETDDLRAACAEAIDSLVDANPDAVLVVGTAETTGERYEPGGVSSFAAYGAPEVEVDIGGRNPPLSLLVGAWLLSRTNTVPWSGLTVARDALAVDCLGLGSRLADDPARLGLLVMGDGSARRSEHAPAHLHPGAEMFDSTVAKALRTADTTVLAGLDPDIADELRVAGRAAWQVLAGATGRGAWRAKLLYDAAPYGVGYFVATWRPTGTGSQRGAVPAKSS
jgi:hypothetical protein